MKIPAVVLVLAVISGCQAGRINLPEPREAWDLMWSKINDYLMDQDQKIDWMMDGMMDGIIDIGYWNDRSSGFIKKLNHLVQQVPLELLRYKEDLWTDGVPYIQEVTGRLTRDLQGLSDRLREHLKATREQVDKYGQELQAMVDLTLEDVRARMATYSRKLKKRLGRDYSEVERYIGTYLSEIQSRSHDHMEDAKTRMWPYLVRVQTDINVKMNTLTDLLGSPMKDSIQTSGEGVKKWMEDTSDGMMASLRSKIQDLDSWCQPYLSTISANL